MCSSDLAIVHGWRSHHGKMVSDRHFSLWFPAWHAHDKLLRVRFMSKPFVIDTKNFAYLHQFERCRTDHAYLSDFGSCHSASSTSSTPSPHPTRPSLAVDSPAAQSRSPSPCYSPYEKENKGGGLSSSFRASDVAALCVRCGFTGHRAASCKASVSSCPERPILIEW